MKTGLKIAFLALAISQASMAVSQKEDTMQEVLKIAHGISVVQPNLSDAEYVSYAIGIHRASKRYGIHPSVLISITQQESGFRPNLPEGPAGELGICQIIKSWLRNPKFIQHFGRMSATDLKKPATSFKIAAWILSSLKDSSLSGPLPFWSFYNSREFKNRFKYFLRVSKHLHSLRKHAPTVYSESVMLAAAPSQEEIPTKIQPKAREVASDRRRPVDAVKAARLLYPKRMSQRAKAADRLIQTASLGDGFLHSN